MVIIYTWMCIEVPSPSSFNQTVKGCFWFSRTLMNITLESAAYTGWPAGWVHGPLCLGCGVFSISGQHFFHPLHKQSQIMGVLCTNYHNFLGTFLHWRQGCHLSSNASSFLMLCLRCHVQCHIWLLRPLPCMIGQQWAFWMSFKL